MSIDINKLKNNKVRKSFDTGDGRVEVYNITAENEHVMNDLFLESYNTETQTLDIKEDTMVELMYKTLTNISFDTLGQLQELLKDPSHVLYMIQNELEKILNEFAIKTFREQETKIDEMLLMVEQAELLQKTDKLINLTQIDKVKLEEEANDDMKKIISDHKKPKNKRV